MQVWSLGRNDYNQASLIGGFFTTKIHSSDVLPLFLQCVVFVKNIAHTVYIKSAIKQGDKMKLKINGNDAVFGKKTATLGKKGALVLSVLIDNYPAVVRHAELMQATGIYTARTLNKQVSLIRASLSPLTKVGIKTHYHTGYELTINK